VQQAADVGGLSVGAAGRLLTDPGSDPWPRSGCSSGAVIKRPCFVAFEQSLTREAREGLRDSLDPLANQFGAPAHRRRPSISCGSENRQVSLQLKQNLSPAPLLLRHFAGDWVGLLGFNRARNC
jgi:hypothetical protein